MIFFLTLIFLLSGLSLLIITQGKKNLIYVKDFAQLSLCHASLISLIKKEIKFMAKTNESIKLAFLASQSPVPQVAVAAKTAHKALISAQNIRRHSYYPRLLKIQECSLPIKVKLRESIPYSQFLTRDLTGVAIVNKTQWQISTRTLWNKHLPNLKAAFIIKNAFDSSPQIKSSNSKVKEFWNYRYAY